MIMKVMPIFLPVISFGLPAGLVIYFAVSNLYRVGQQWFISRSLYGGKEGLAAAKAAASATAVDAPKDGASRWRWLPGQPQAGGRGLGIGEHPPAKSTPAKSQRSTAKATPAKSAGQVERGQGTRDLGSSPAVEARHAAADAGQGRRRRPRTLRPHPLLHPGGATLQPRARKNKKR